MLTMPYDTESNFRNADFILIAREGDTTPSEPACQRQAEPFEPSEPGPRGGPLSGAALYIHYIHEKLR